MLTTLRRKILLSVVVTFVVASTALYLASSRILLGGFERLEQESALTDVKRVEEALEESLVTVQKFVGDWCGWNETRDFVLGIDQDKYTEDNLQDSTLVNLHVQFIAYLDVSGRVVRVKSVDLKEEKAMPDLPGLVRVTSQAALLHHNHPRDLKHGIVMTPDGPMLVAAGPITNNLYELPIHGTLIGGRLLDEEEAEALGRRTHLKVAFYRTDQAGLPPDVQEALKALSAGSSRVVRAQGADVVAGYSQIRDVAGNPALILRIEESRAILRQGVQTTRLFTVVLLLAGLITLSILMIALDWAVLRPIGTLHRHVVRIRDSKDLATRVEVRSRDELGALARAFNETAGSLREAQAELEVAHRKLMETARQAGMAEVASGVLHNVGNVLNSVNIATTAIKRQVHDLRIDNLARAADLMNEHAGDLGRFLTEDERGARLPAYVTGLAQNLKAEQNELGVRLAELEKHVQHIAEVISLQQSSARKVGVIEPVDLAEIVEDAVKINAAALTRHEITVERNFAQTPPFLADRHQALQILINLISNAKYALRDSDQRPKRITLRIEPPSAGRVRVTVSDNGVGIAQENRDRIFAHGFTTRPDGHGFGLHSAALAAGQLDGSLSVHSEGPGRGATFVLELPFREAAR